MSLPPNELARRDAGGLRLAPDPVRVSWTLDDLPAADGHGLRCRVSCGARAVNEPAELRMLQDVLMGPRPALSADDVARYLGPTLRDAGAAVSKDKGAEAWLAGGGGARDALAAALRAAADRAAFACGLELLPPFQLELDSPSFERRRQQELQRALAEQEAAGRVEHFNRAADLLKRFEDLREKAPDLPPGAILSQLSPVDQGAALQSLLLASARRQPPTSLWAVGGEYLVRIDGQDNGPPAVELFPLPPTLGPLRSVQPAHIDGDRLLLVGARAGFYLVRADDPTRPEVYPDPGAAASALGFSRVVFLGHERGFAGCHGEAGLVRWAYKHDHGPSGVLRPERFGAAAAPAATFAAPPPLPGAASASMASGTKPPGPRNLQTLGDGRLLLTVGGTLWVIDGDAATAVPSASSADVVAVVPDGRVMRVVHEDGTIAAVDAATRQVVDARRRPTRVRAAGGLPWLGTTRLLLAGDDGPVQCLGTGDGLVSEYVSAHRGLRAVAGSPEWVAGVSGDRQRLLLWRAWDGKAPAAEVYLTARTKHRIADIDFG
ncbi:MAG: hypothetical protein JWO31_409 [Phycisphaerales bacterium]|nr:hypothetical protein [Phycisphaerales bacterium]